MSQEALIPSPLLLVDPNGVYEEGSIAIALGITLSSLLTARRVGELKFVRRGRRVFITGRNLLAWMEPSTATPAKVVNHV
jgi:hypothetical protein